MTGKLDFFCKNFCSEVISILKIGAKETELSTLQNIQICCEVHAAFY
jgi:hypothetical protein